MTKVERVCEKYDLGEIGEDLECRWLGIDRERQSLRELEDFFNVRVLERALERTDLSTAPEDLRHTYELLHGDASTSARTRTKRKLEREGVDVDALLNDFVTHQAIHTYLTKRRDLTPPTADNDPVESDRLTINRFLSKTATVVKSKVDRLIQRGELADTDVEVFVSAEVFCNDCGRSHSVSEYLENGGCDCG